MGPGGGGTGRTASPFLLPGCCSWSPEPPTWTGSSVAAGAFLGGSLVVVEEGAQGTNFCNAFHPVAYVRERLARGWEVADFVPMGAKGNPHQDLFLLRRC